MARKTLLQRFFPNENYDLFWNEVARNIPEEGCILDLGCGDNRFLSCWRNARRRVWGADFQAHPQLCHAAWFRLLEKDGRLPFPDQSIDLITSSWVLEHVAQPELFLAEVARTLRPGGMFVSLTVNAKHYVPCLARLLHLVPHSWTQKLIHLFYGRPGEDTFPTFYRMNLLCQVARAARNANLHVKYSKFYASPDYFAFSKVLHGLANFTDWLLEGVWPTLGKIYWVVSLEKKQSPQVSAGAGHKLAA